MCGLAGVANLAFDTKTQSRANNIFINTFLSSQLRGFDSSGCSILFRQNPKKDWLTQHKRGKARVGWVTYKDIDSPFDVYQFALADMYRRADKNKNSHENPYPVVVLGHSRAATIGDITAENAHPFSFCNNRFIGTHNGTIHGARTVLRTLVNDSTPLKGTEDIDDMMLDAVCTDSEIILYSIYRFGIEKVYPLIEGAWALVYWDAKAGSLNIIRNSARTLFYYVHGGSDSIHWSSEKDMLEFAIKRDGLNFDAKRLHVFKPDRLYTLTYDKPRTLAWNCDDITWSSEINMDAFKKSRARTHIARNSTRDYYKRKTEVRESEKKPDRNVITLPPRKDKNGGPSSTPPVVRTLKNSISCLVFGADPDNKDTSVDESRETTCIHCSEHTNIPRLDDDFLEVTPKGTEQGGPVCIDCQHDWHAMEFLLDAFPWCGDEVDWRNRLNILYLDQANKETIRNG